MTYLSIKESNRYDTVYLVFVLTDIGIFVGILFSRSKKKIFLSVDDFFFLCFDRVR